MAFFSIVLIHVNFNVKRKYITFILRKKIKLSILEKNTNNFLEEDILSVSCYFEFQRVYVIFSFKALVLLMEIIFAFQLGQW